MRAVNLLPRDEAPKSFENRRGVAFGAAGGTALVTVILAAAMISAGGAASAEQSRLDSLNAELAAMPQPDAVDEDAAPEAVVAEKTARITALSSALGDRVAWDRILRQVSQVLPKDVWLTSISCIAATKPKDGVELAEGQSLTPTLTLAGSTYSVDGVARVLSRLAVTPAIESVTLQSTNIQAVGARKIVQFTILANVRTAGSPS
jgi:Tfp pilus assembly protein PilN